MSLAGRVVAAVKRYFFSGVLVVVPLILTYLVLRFLFDAVDGVLAPLLAHMLGYYVTGLGILVTLLLIILAGIATRGFLGHQLYAAGDRVLQRMPLVRPVYGAAKQLLEAIVRPSASAFQEVGLIEYPRRGTWAVCFVSNRVQLLPPDTEHPDHYLAVFVPSSPTPFSGYVVLVRAEEVLPVEMNLEEAVKFIVSGGVASPSLIKQGVVTFNS